MQLSKKLSAIEKETMRNELITIDLLKTERENIAKTNCVKQELRDMNNQVKEY